jgi:antitoxin VapB
MTTIAKLFMSGRSQALRLPAKLRLSATEVRIEQIGADLWLHPESPEEQDMALWLKRFYASTDPLPEDFMAERADEAAQERDWS